MLSALVRFLLAHAVAQPFRHAATPVSARSLSTGQARFPISTELFFPSDTSSLVGVTAWFKSTTRLATLSTKSPTLGSSVSRPAVLYIRRIREIFAAPMHLPNTTYATR